MVIKLAQFIPISKNSINHLTLSPPALKVSLFSLLLSLCTNVEESKTKRRWQWHGILLAYEHHNKISKNWSFPVTLDTHQKNGFGSILMVIIEVHLKIIIVRYALIWDQTFNVATHPIMTKPYIQHKIMYQMPCHLGFLNQACRAWFLVENI